MRRVSPLTIPMLMPNGPAAAVGLALGARGGVHAPVSACASGAEAIALGPGPDPRRPGRRGRGRRHRGVRAPAADGRLRPDAGDVAPATTSRRRRPARSTRAGTASSSARAPACWCWSGRTTRRPAGARAYARLAGAGITSDGYHITAPDPEGNGAARAIAQALRDAGPDAGGRRARQRARHLDPGRRRRRGDRRSATAIGDHPLVTATKSMTGHLLGAAGAVEAIATVLASATTSCRRPATSTTSTTRSRLDVVRVEPRRLPVPAARQRLLRLRRPQRGPRRPRRPDARPSALAVTRMGPPDHPQGQVKESQVATPLLDRPDAPDPRDPEVRLAALLRPRVAAQARAVRQHRRAAPRRAPSPGSRVIAYCTDATEDGRRDGLGGLPAHRRRDRHRGARAGAGDRALALRRRPAGRGRRGAGRGRPGVRRDGPRVRPGAADLGRARRRPPAAPPTGRR